MPDEKEPTVATTEEGSGNPETQPTRITPESVSKMLSGEPEEKEKKGSPTPEPEADKDALSKEADKTAPTEEPEKKEDEPLPKDRNKLIESIRRLKSHKRELRGELSERDRELTSLRDELSQLRKKLEEPKMVVDPIVEETDAEVLAEREAEAQQVYDWTEQLLDRLSDDDDVAGVGALMEKEGLQAPEDGWTRKGIREQLAGMKQRAKATLKVAPQRRHFLAAEQQATETVADLVPELADEKDPLGDEVRKLLKSYPWLKQLPNWPLAATAQVLGTRELIARANKGGKGGAKAEKQEEAPPIVPRSKPPKVPGAPKVADVPVKDDLQKLRSAAVQRGSSRDSKIAFVSRLLSEAK